MSKEWKKKKVALHHGYLNNKLYNDLTRAPHHKMFGEWLSQKFKNYSDLPPTIFDVGCGNGHVTSYLLKFNKYVGIDINESVIDCAKKKKIDNTLFFLQDIEENIKKEVLQEIKSCQICYIDSVFTMLEDPAYVLKEILIPNFDFIFLNRTGFNNQKTEKTKMLWGGMDHPSTVWKFNIDFFQEVAKQTNSSFKAANTNGGIIIYEMRRAGVK